MNRTTAKNSTVYADAKQAERLKALGIQPPELHLGTLLTMIPSVIYSCDCSGNLKPYQWKMWRTESYSFELDGENCFEPRVYGMMYETFSVFPAEHPISPCGPHFESLYGEDGNMLIWSDESPVEMAVSAIEWLVAHKFINPKEL